MQQLISIKRVPIEVEINVQRAEIKPVENSGSSKKPLFPQLNVSRKNNAISLKAAPVKLDISDTGIVSKSPAPIQNKPKKQDTFSSDGGSPGLTLSYKGYVNMDVKEGAVEIGSSKKSPAMDIKATKASRSIETILGALPKTKNKQGVSFSNGKISIDYNIEIGRASCRERV